MPPLVLIVAFLYAPFVFIAGSNLLNATQQLYEAPDWVINIARPINGVIALLCIVSVFIVERKILTKSPEKSPTTRGTGGLMKTPRRGLKASRFLQITIQYQERSRQAKRL